MINNSRLKQRGMAAVEFSLLGIVMFALIVFTADVSIKMGVKGRLDRLTYSAVNLVKEQTSLSSDNDFSVEDIYKIIRNSMYRTSSQSGFDETNLVVLLETMTTEMNSTEDGVITVDTSSYYGDASVTDSPLSSGDTPLKDYVDTLDVSIVNEVDDYGDEKTVVVTFAPYLSTEEYADVYQVSACYKTDNWYGDFIDSVNETSGTSFDWVCSNSIAFER